MNNNTNANGATFDPYLSWLGIRDPQRPPNHYRLLGLELFESDADVIASAADRQMAYIRTYQAGQQGEHSQRILNELTTAKLCLLKPDRKRDYDQRLQAAQKPPAPVPLPPQPPQVPPLATAMPPRSLPPAQAYSNAPVAANQSYPDYSSPYGAPPVSARSQPSRPAKYNAVMQWSIVGGLVLAAVILVVILANKHDGNEPAPIAEKPIVNNPTPPKGTPTGAKNPPATPNRTNPPETGVPTEPVTVQMEPTKAASQTPAVTGTGKAIPPKAPAPDPIKDRPGPVKATLPNVALPGIEEPSSPSPNPMNAGSPNATPMNPAPAVNPTPATNPTTVATNDDPLNSLPTSNGNNPSMPGPPTMGNPLNPSSPPANPLDVKPMPGAMPMPPEQRRPMPSVKEIADSRATVREIFKAEYAAKAITLPKALLTSAGESGDQPAVMYATYDEARFVGAALNDVDTVLTAHDELVSRFAIDRDKDVLETVKVLAKYSITMNAEAAGRVLDVIEETASSAMTEQRFEVADQLLKYVTNFSPRIQDKVTREVIFRDMQKKVGEYKAFAIRSKEYNDALVKNPDDADANFELGKFWAFQQNNFEKGNPYLAKGSDAEVREAARRELTIKPDAPELVKVADAWWEAAGKLPPDPRAAVKIHAACVYARALPTLKSLDRGLAESRINEAYKLFKPNNREVKELLRILITRVSWKMDWKSRPIEARLTFNPDGTCSSFEYPSWKLLDNYYVVCYRDPGSPDQFGGGGGGFGGGGMGGRRFRGPGGANNIDANNFSRAKDYARNVMQIAVISNRIDIRVLDNEGRLSNEGTGVPD